MFRTDGKCNNKGKWDNKAACEVKQFFESSERLQQLRDIELRIVVRYLKKTKHAKLKESVTKQTKIQELSKILQLHHEAPLAPKRSRKRTVKTLSEMAAHVLSTKVSKHVLNCVYAENIWPDRYADWQRNGTIDPDLTIGDTNEPERWFYQPEYSIKREQLEVRCIDSTHLLTRTRRKSCKGGLSGVSNYPWLKVAKSGKTFLTQIMVEEITDPMSVSMAATHFSEAVEKEMMANGNKQASALCHDIRLWWESEDSSGISARDRILMRSGLRNRLLSHVDFSTFPPPTMYVNGWPLQLWEALIANIDAKALLYSICHAGTYNVRSFSSLIGETFFSELVLNDKMGQGTVTAQDFGRFIGTSMEQLHIRLEPERQFVYRTARSSVYKLVENCDEFETDHVPICEVCSNRSRKRVQCICIQNHFFDSAERRRGNSNKKFGTVSTNRNAIQKGTLGVRWESARRNESKMLLTSKMGIDINQ